MGRGWIVLLAGCCGAGAGCGRTENPPAIVIGHVANLGGGSGSPGEQAVMGIDLALAEVNEDKSAAPLHVRHVNAQGKLENFEAEASRLLALNDCAALVGGQTPEEVARLDKARPAAPDRPTQFRPLFSPCGWQAAGLSDQVFLVGMRPRRQGEILARFAVDKLDGASLVVLLDERREDLRVAAESAERAFLDAFAKRYPGSEPRRPVLLTFGKDETIDDLLPRLRRENPRAVLLAGDAGDLAALHEKLAPPRPLLFYAGPDGSLKADDLPPEATVYLASAFAVDAPEKSLQAFVAAFREKYKVEPTVHAALGHASMRILAGALRKSPGSERLRDELRAIKDFPGLAGPLSFTPQGQLQRPLFVLRMTAGREQLQQQYPPEEAKKVKEKGDE